MLALSFLINTPPLPGLPSPVSSDVTSPVGGFPDGSEGAADGSDLIRVLFKWVWFASAPDTPFSSCVPDLKELLGDGCVGDGGGDCEGEGVGEMVGMLNILFSRLDELVNVLLGCFRSICVVSSSFSSPPPPPPPSTSFPPLPLPPLLLPSSPLVLLLISFCLLSLSRCLFFLSRRSWVGVFFFRLSPPVMEDEESRWSSDLPTPESTLSLLLYSVGIVPVTGS